MSVNLSFARICAERRKFTIFTDLLSIANENPLVKSSEVTQRSIKMLPPNTQFHLNIQAVL